MILVFGGTTEGRIVCSVLDTSGQEYYYSTKGEAQEVELVHGHRLMGAMTYEAMCAFIREQGIRLVIDAAHPFAAELHRTIGRATADMGVAALRYERRYPPLDPRIITCASYEEMIDRLLMQPAHRLLALTGVNTLRPMKRFWSQRESYFRILDRDDSREKAAEVGFPSSHIRYFVEGEDQQLFDEIQPDAVTTKESGESGFFDAKIAPALSAGVPVYMITRPPLPEHYHTVNGPVGLRKAVQDLAPGFFALKSGFTTGSTATAATVAALRALVLGEETAERAEIELPSGEVVALPILSVERTERGYLAGAIKYSGDDPDITHGAEIWAEVRHATHGEVRFLQGVGVGRVTLPGIGIEVGEPAINSTPRMMMTREVRRLIPEGGIDIIISIPKGEELAEKTFNPRLGIVGGISVIGTSGVVKPFSSEAFIASIAKQVDVAISLGAETIVINSGAKSEGYLRERFSGLPAQSFVQYGNFIGETLKELATHEEVRQIYMGIMLGKAVKLAEGNTDTHSKKVVMNRTFLHTLAERVGTSKAAHALIDELTLARELWTGLAPEDLNRMMSEITRACHEVCQPLVPGRALIVLLIDDEGTIRYQC
ncbi:MAG: cobalt-precorrin-5B (C(1))-methyltransferase CbiD [Porphyromonadaceae bacterium]|nr:cobalt-precorrin-5B (C(1))-methyltransferase CbiD [Porphyromonadaceae bacterium]